MFSQEFNALRFMFCFLVCLFALTPAIAQQPFDPARGIILRGTVVTMDDAGTILHKGNVLIRNGKILATLEGPHAPDGTSVGNASDVTAVSVRS